MKMRHYVLVGQTAVPVEADPYTPEGIAGLLEWARWFEDGENRRVLQTNVLGLVLVSTVFLGIDHSFTPGRPLLFETMAFWDGARGDEQERCSTWLQAEEQHRRMVTEVVRPRAVLAWVGRTWHDYWSKARRAWLLSGSGGSVGLL